MIRYKGIRLNVYGVIFTLATLCNLDKPDIAMPFLICTVITCAAADIVDVILEKKK